MNKVRISLVKYLNAVPFHFGLKSFFTTDNVKISLDTPAVCSDKLQAGKVDIGLIPVVSIPEISGAEIFSSYCIGSHGSVKSVMLYSDVPIQEVKSILLDYQSKTSVQLIKILAYKFWQIKVNFIHAKFGYEHDIQGSTAGLVIGDRALSFLHKFSYQYDLSECWKSMTGMPFVFACWVTNKKLSKPFQDDFNQALLYGLNNKSPAVKALVNRNDFAVDLTKYLRDNISYNYDYEKKNAMQHFLVLSKELEEAENQNYQTCET
jgi:chorismate dehydratase